MWRVILMALGLVLWSFWACGQFSAVNAVFWSDGFHQKGGPFGSNAYPALLCKPLSPSIAAFGTTLFGTELGHYELLFSLPVKGNGIGLSLTRSGSSVMYQSAVTGSWAKPLDPDFSLAMRVGIFSSVVQGYYSKVDFTAGLGMSWDISSQCRWLLQVENIPSLFSRESSGTPEIRSGLGYQFSDHLEGSVQAVVSPSQPPVFMVVLSYQPVELLGFRTGYSKDLFTTGVVFSFRQLELTLQSSWHMVLGFSHGLGLVYRKKEKS